jgi:sulfide:quinone oxidoreductase
MANVLILGGGFGGVVAAERLAETLAPEHKITLVSRSSRFTFYPALVRLAFGKCEAEDISYDLREAMLDRRVRFIQAEVVRVDPAAHKVTLAGGDVAGELEYDYLIYALGRRLATEEVPGFFEHAHHLLGVAAALRFKEALHNFHGGHACIGSCPGARLDVPVYETAFALSRLLAERGEEARITVIAPEHPAGAHPGSTDLARALRPALEAHGIKILSDFPIRKITAEHLLSDDGLKLEYDLLMLVPPFEGASALADIGLTNQHGYVRVDQTMRVCDTERMYAVGDAVYFSGPKMGHMAVRQAEVAAGNLVAELEGRPADAVYEHEMMLVVDEGGRDSIYFHKNLWGDETSVRQGRFWGWVKRMRERYFRAQHS